MSDTRDRDGGDLSAILSDLARTLQAEPDVDTTLKGIVKAAVDHITGSEYAGISLVEGRRKITTVVPSDEIVIRIDQAQYRTGQGPCVDAIADHEIYRSGELTAEDR